MLCIIGGVMRISAVINTSGWCLYDIVNSFFIHIGWTLTAYILIIGNQTGTIEAVHNDDFRILDFHHISRLHNLTALFWYAVAQPFFHTLLRTDKRYGSIAVFQYRCCIEWIDMIVMIMCG